MRLRVDLTGQRFGLLTAVGRLDDGRWECRCDCGGSANAFIYNLRSGNTRSCGCEHRRLAAESHTTHGMTGTMEYTMLVHARQRAKAAGLPCTIEVEDIHIPELCPALGIPLLKGTDALHDASPSLDRLRPDEGYVPGNVVVISHLANAVKQNCTSALVLAVADWMESQGL